MDPPARCCNDDAQGVHFVHAVQVHGQKADAATTINTVPHGRLAELEGAYNAGKPAFKRKEIVPLRVLPRQRG